MSFFERLERETAAERFALYSVPQLLDGVQGRITRETYLAYLAEAFHHVSQTVPLLTAARDGMDERHAAYRAALDEYIAEETGHEQWILNDISRAGGDAEAVRTGPPRPSTELMVAYAHDYVRRINPMGMFGMVYVLEGTSIALATHGAGAVSKALGLGPECFSYLSSHGALDQEHMTFFAGLMNTVEDPADQAAILHVARRIFVLFAGMFRSIPHERELAHAV
ncbi:MAG: iron-containing redox enzyme family protein [Alphaproteobacteria bacterium]|nr:iron-containing redox enzyme family protein [Alphaproteobacteria bacterium]MBU1513194.1 iron-containing redox enzyme family protein [Alphaproteobacteria bacterium]MBU2095302.1 iron-containing redox enzyme family protein [Alphaproteobacteria bacterium]MBU2152217.1 iron-containing redox enzyme family protein [Alphaproteobacteria bacterium]MBU2306736.1 iron-containing redox enzyme family protein [Alphaproteobacteria bacterium]